MRWFMQHPLRWNGLNLPSASTQPLNLLDHILRLSRDNLMGGTSEGKIGTVHAPVLVPASSEAGLRIPPLPVVSHLTTRFPRFCLSNLTLQTHGTRG
ncbi:hypothetical protein NPIL_169401 [Nephila pilipes]|uniref:Uncharacterized protein n=1 Tax=Nephila pilipes TaxID=299642 RepID=A0A8X6PP01_NEPPI|nr:hypothetical protein NPIL_169401 [Nephila pilipes]